MSTNLRYTIFKDLLYRKDSISEVIKDTEDVYAWLTKPGEVVADLHADVCRSSIIDTSRFVPIELQGEDSATAHKSEDKLQTPNFDAAVEELCNLIRLQKQNMVSDVERLSRDIATRDVLLKKYEKLDNKKFGMYVSRTYSYSEKIFNIKGYLGANSDEDLFSILRSFLLQHDNKSGKYETAESIASEKGY